MVRPVPVVEAGLIFESDTMLIAGSTHGGSQFPGQGTGDRTARVINEYLIE